MLSGVTLSASEMAGTAVFRIVVSSDSMKNATATSHGRSFLLEADGAVGIEGELVELTGLMAMESKNYSANEWKDLLEFGRDSAKSSARLLGLLSPGVWSAPLVIICTKAHGQTLSFASFLLR
jgi:hypothetical protein